MPLPTAMKIMKMSATALAKKYGARAAGLSKRVKAGQVVNAAKKGKRAKFTNLKEVRLDPDQVSRARSRGLTTNRLAKRFDKGMGVSDLVKKYGK